MMRVIIVIIFILLILYLSYKFYHYAYWVYNRSKVAPRISFENFKEFYAINPNKWDIRDEDSLRYDYDNVEFETYADFKKYKKFSKRINSEARKEESDAEQLRRQANFIRDVQKDIDKYRKDAIDKMKMLSHEECKEELNYIVYALVGQDNGISCISYDVSARSKDDAAEKIKSQYDNAIEIMRVDAVYE